MQMKRRIIIKPFKAAEKGVTAKLWPYHYDDIDTWPWLECKIAGDEIRYVSMWVKNPNFKYGHLIKGY